MNKDDSIQFRINGGSKARWQGMAEQLEYSSLSAFIEDTIESVHFPPDYEGQIATVHGMTPHLQVVLEDGKEADFEREPIVAEPQPVVTREAIEAEIASRPLHYMAEASPVVSAAQVVKTGCTGAANHRKGIFCKSCKKVI